MTGEQAGRRSRRVMTDALPRLIAVLGAAALVLRLADAVPGVVLGSARGVRHFDTIGALEHTLGWRVPLPAFFPDVLAWPPTEIRAVDHSALTLGFVRRDTAAPWLLLGAGAGQNEVLPNDLIPEALVLQASRTDVAGQPAGLRRLREADGTLWHELAWRRGPLWLVVRYRGPLDELATIAASVQGPRR